MSLFNPSHKDLCESVWIYYVISAVTLQYYVLSLLTVKDEYSTYIHLYKFKYSMLLK